jgi:hypothetical protein
VLAAVSCALASAPCTATTSKKYDVTPTTHHDSAEALLQTSSFCFLPGDHFKSGIWHAKRGLAIRSNMLQGIMPYGTDTVHDWCSQLLCDVVCGCRICQHTRTTQLTATMRHVLQQLLATPPVLSAVFVTATLPAIVTKFQRWIEQAQRCASPAPLHLSCATAMSTASLA